MWPLRKKETVQKSKYASLRKVVAGVIFGAAIASIIGRKMLEKHDKEENIGEENETET